MAEQEANQKMRNQKWGKGISPQILTIHSLLHPWKWLLSVSVPQQADGHEKLPGRPALLAVLGETLPPVRGRQLIVFRGWLVPWDFTGVALCFGSTCWSPPSTYPNSSGEITAWCCAWARFAEEAAGNLLFQTLPHRVPPEEQISQTVRNITRSGWGQGQSAPALLSAAGGDEPVAAPSVFRPCGDYYLRLSQIFETAGCHQPSVFHSFIDAENVVKTIWFCAWLL